MSNTLQMSTRKDLGEQVPEERTVTSTSSSSRNCASILRSKRKKTNCTANSQGPQSKSPTTIFRFPLNLMLLTLTSVNCNEQHLFKILKTEVSRGRKHFLNMADQKTAHQHEFNEFLIVCLQRRVFEKYFLKCRLARVSAHILITHSNFITNFALGLDS